MSASAKLRLVRCPKCENLLPELADYSVYQCGGCGTVLRGIFHFYVNHLFSLLWFDLNLCLKYFIFYVVGYCYNFELGFLFGELLPLESNLVLFL